MFIRITILLVMLNCVCSSAVMAQYFAMEYIPFEKNSFTAVHPTQDEGYIAAGMRSSDNKLHVIKLRWDGYVEWYRVFRGVKMEVKDIDEIGNAWIIVGNGYSDNNYGVNVISLDFLGNLNWHRVYRSTDGLPIVNGVVGAQGLGKILIGGTFAWDGADEDFWVMRLLVNGSVIWQYTYNHLQSEISEMGKAIDARKRNIILAGEAYVDGDTDIWLVELNGIGDVIGYKNLNNSYQYEYVSEVKYVNSSDHLLVAGTCNETSGSPSPTDMLLMRVDLQDCVPPYWSYRYGAAGIGKNETGEAMVQNANGEVLLTGASQIFGSTSYASVFKIKESNGDVYWFRYYDFFNLNGGSFLSIDKTYNSDFVVAGFWDTGTDQHGMVAHLDGAGMVGGNTCGSAEYDFVQTPYPYDNPCDCKEPERRRPAIEVLRLESSLADETYIETSLCP